MSNPSNPDTTVVLQSAIKTVQTNASELNTKILKFRNSHTPRFSPSSLVDYDTIVAAAAELVKDAQALTAFAAGPPPREKWSPAPSEEL